MSWSSSLVLRLRYYLNDIDSDNYTWTDIQLQNFIILSFIEVGMDVSDYGGFSQVFDYNLDSSSPSITPDPVLTESEALLSLVILKSTCKIANAELKKQSGTNGFMGIRIVDDKSTIDTKGALKDMAMSAEWACSTYDKALYQYKSNLAFDGDSVWPPYANYNDFTHDFNTENGTHRGA